MKSLVFFACLFISLSCSIEIRSASQIRTTVNSFERRDLRFNVVDEGYCAPSENTCNWDTYSQEMFVVMLPFFGAGCLFLIIWAIFMLSFRCCRPSCRCCESRTRVGDELKKATNTLEINIITFSLIAIGVLLFGLYASGTLDTNLSIVVDEVSSIPVDLQYDLDQAKKVVNTTIIQFNLQNEFSQQLSTKFGLANQAVPVTRTATDNFHSSINKLFNFRRFLSSGAMIFSCLLAIFSIYAILKQEPLFSFQLGNWSFFAVFILFFAASLNVASIFYTVDICNAVDSAYPNLLDSSSASKNISIQNYTSSFEVSTKNTTLANWVGCDSNVSRVYLQEPYGITEKLRQTLLVSGCQLYINYGPSSLTQKVFDHTTISSSYCQTVLSSPITQGQNVEGVSCQTNTSTLSWPWQFCNTTTKTFIRSYIQILEHETVDITCGNTAGSSILTCPQHCVNTVCQQVTSNLINYFKHIENTTDPIIDDNLKPISNCDYLKDYLSYSYDKTCNSGLPFMEIVFGACAFVGVLYWAFPIFLIRGHLLFGKLGKNSAENSLLD